MRSSLAELELQASQAMQRLENVKINANADQSQLNETPVITPSHSNNGLLSSERHAPSEILTLLESLMIANAMDPEDSDNIENGEPEYLLPALNEVSHLALISHSIIAYMCHLDYRKLTKITAKVSGDTNRWLGNLFRFPNGHASYHTDSTDAILRAVR